MNEPTADMTEHDYALHLSTRLKTLGESDQLSHTRDDKVLFSLCAGFIAGQAAKIKDLESGRAE